MLNQENQVLQVGSVCRGIQGSVCCGIRGSVWRGKRGAGYAESPILDLFCILLFITFLIPILVQFNLIDAFSKLIGLEAIILKNSKVIFNAVEVECKGNIFEIAEVNLGIESYDELFKILSTRLPITLTISGNGLLHKKAEGGLNLDLMNVFSKVFPHSNPKEFYVQQSAEGGNNSTYISIIRKDQLNPLLTKLDNFKVINVAFGPFAVRRLLPIMEVSNFINDKINLGHYKLSYNSNYIENVSWTEEIKASAKIRLGEEEYDAASIIPYASVLNYYAPDNLIKVAEIESVAAKKQDFQYEEKFKVTGIVLAAIFFGILLANFLLFNNYFSKSKDLKQSLSINSRSIAQLDSLKKELDSHKQVLASYNFKGMSKTSYYADQIAATVPHSITLEELYLFPLKKGDAGYEDLLFDNKKILISGYSRASIDLNEWIKQLQQNNWAGKVNILSYNQTGGKDKGKFSVEVELL